MTCLLVKTVKVSHIKEEGEENDQIILMDILIGFLQQKYDLSVLVITAKVSYIKGEGEENDQIKKEMTSQYVEVWWIKTILIVILLDNIWLKLCLKRDANT